MVNPYEAPTKDIEQEHESTLDGEQLATGQKRLIASVALGYIGTAATREVPVLMVLCGMAVLALRVDGVLKIGRSLGWSRFAIVVSLIFMLIPIVDLITLLWLSSRATNALRRAGYEVGLFGASR